MNPHEGKKTVGIIGMGLMGASFGKAFRALGHTVYGDDTDADTRRKALTAGAADALLTDADADKPDVFIFALNPRAFAAAARKFTGKMKSGAIVSDICGNKRRAVEDMHALAAERPDLNYVAAHPMAGTESRGIDHSDGGLFRGASALIIPVSATAAAVETLRGLYLSVGFSRVIETDAERHDRIIAYTSQLAHVISSAYIVSPTAARQDGFSAGSFRDLSRVARMNAAMWTELTADNRGNLLAELDAFTARLALFRAALASGDEKSLLQLFEEGNLRKAEIDGGAKTNDSKGN
jgi:prephenate dehydrogenase